MPKVKMQAKELEDADVSFISLVSRPASRIPFRVTKSEDLEPEHKSTMEKTMIHLNKLFKQDGEPAVETPSVVGVAVRKADLDTMKPQLEAAGYKVEDTIEQDDAVILKQEDFNEDDVTVIKTADAAYLVKGVKKSFEPYSESIEFADNMAGTGFMPSLMVATEALMDTYRNVISKAESPEVMAEQLQKAVESYGSYVTDMAGKLPSSVFKADIAEVKVDELEDVAKEDMDKCPEGQKWDKEMGKCVAMDKKDEAKKEEGESDEATGVVEKETDNVEKQDGDDAQASAEQESEVVKSEEGSDKESGETVEKGESSEDAASEDDSNNGEEVAKSEEIPAWVQAFKDEVMGGIDTVKKEVEDLKKSGDELSDRISTVEEVAKSADEAVKGTVASDSGVFVGDNLGNQSQTMRKSEGEDDIWGDTPLDRITG